MRLPFLLMLFSLLYGCASDTEAVEEQTIERLGGRWELVEARRDNVRTGLLDGLYFVFGEEQRFETNLLTGDLQVGKYYYDEAEITTEGVEAPMTFEVLSLAEGVLVLRSRYEGFIFDFLMRRSEEAPTT